MSDECNGPAGAAVNGSKWNMIHSGGGFGNQEIQFYTNRTMNFYYDGNGNLVIKTLRVNRSAAIIILPPNFIPNIRRL